MSVDNQMEKSFAVEDREKGADLVVSLKHEINYLLADRGNPGYLDDTLDKILSQLPEKPKASEVYGLPPKFVEIPDEIAVEYATAAFEQAKDRAFKALANEDFMTSNEKEAYEFYRDCMRELGKDPLVDEQVEYVIDKPEKII